MITKKTNLHIIGTHGVPAKYGGFETLADFLCQQFQDRYEITVYCSTNQYEKKISNYYGSKLKYIGLKANGIQGIVYDLITFIIALFKADVILYLSPVGSGFMTPLRYLTKVKVIINHGGLNEWEREKLNKFQKIWAKFNHLVSAKTANINIADNSIYQQSILSNFNSDSIIIRYGGDHAKRIGLEDARFCNKYEFIKSKYAISVSRAQIDNNIHLVLEAFQKLKDYKLVLISNWQISNYGIQLKKQYSQYDNIILLDAIYDKDELNYLRSNSYVYIHSHSRCGTAPSLVEAMSLGCPIISFDAATNRETTENKAIYFQNSHDLSEKVKTLTIENIENNAFHMNTIAKKEYTWNKIAHQYSKIIDELAK